MTQSRDRDKIPTPIFPVSVPRGPPAAPAPLFKFTRLFESMARRSAAPNSGPTYYSRSAVTARPGIQDLDDVETSAFSRFMSEEIWAPEKLQGNIAIVTSVGVFAAGIFFVRKFGDLIIP